MRSNSACRTSQVLFWNGCGPVARQRKCGRSDTLTARFQSAEGVSAIIYNAEVWNRMLVFLISPSVPALRSCDPWGGVASSKRFTWSGQCAHFMTFHLTAEQPSTSLSWSAASLKQKSRKTNCLISFFPACAGCSITGCSVFFSFAAAFPSVFPCNHSPASLGSRGQHQFVFAGFFPWLVLLWPTETFLGWLDGITATVQNSAKT